MTSWQRLLLIPIALGAVIFDPRSGGVGDASAQLSPTQLPQPGNTEQADKPEGVAEEAEEDSDQLPTTPVLPQAKSKRKRFELLEFDGYYRLRTDWFKNFHMGFQESGQGGAPFAQSLGCGKTETDSGGEVMVVGPCEETLKGTNMRLRLEPIINVNETTRVFFQMDILDNVGLGSTPDPAALAAGSIPLGAFTGNQAPPEAGRNSLTDSVRVRRAWAEVETDLGQLTFGRQPWHWGLGIYANAGGLDPFSGTYDLNSDHGDTVDRVMFRAEIPGTNLEAALAMDWPSSYPAASQAGLFDAQYSGQDWDLDDRDDVDQWVFAITRFDSPALFAESVARGELALNYGGMLVYRTQDWATRPPAAGETLTDTLVQRGLKSYTPDVWLKLGLGKLSLELEAVAVLGKIDHVSDIALPRYPSDPGNPDATETVDEAVDIRGFGGVARVGYRAMEDKLHVSVELGTASGDQWDNTPAGATHVQNARPLPVGGTDTSVQNFLFDFDFDVDLILFRELLGTVTNATYIKPGAAYAVTDEITFRGRGILSFANVPVATPGNDSIYGLELDGDVSYHSGPFTVGVSYGVLLPMGALDHPEGTGEDGPGYGFTENSGDAGTAQTFQTRLMIQF